MPVLRLFVPVIAALVLLLQPVATWAAAGIQRDLSCCCPDPDECECHDHDGKGPSSPSMRRCDTGKLQVVAPIVLVADIPAAAPVAVDVQPVAAPAAEPAIMPEARSVPPEKPPF